MKKYKHVFIFINCKFQSFDTENEQVETKIENTLQKTDKLFVFTNQMRYLATLHLSSVTPFILKDSLD